MIRPYLRSDYDEIVDWYKAWHEPIPPECMLPEIGFIVPGSCAGFLYKTDSKLGIIDCFISNPHTNEKMRDRHLNMLVEELIHEARLCGFSALMASSSLDTIKKRSEGFGFIYKGDTSLYLKEI